MIKNPILPGFYSDPSICRVEDDFYLVTSSFSFYPGVPIFHSRDLANWEQLGHVLNRPEQLLVSYEMLSGGIFAPTIRYHQGIYYLITTNMSLGCKNFIVTAEDPKGPWSDIHIIEGADGIDPSLFFDQDGRAYYTGTTRVTENDSQYQAIWGSEIDVKEMKLVGERRILWKGALSEAYAPEGPHIYQKDGWYYLMIAEGGTEHHHSITISRSKTVLGAYHGCPANPILTHRHLGKLYPICNVGHGDLVELADNSWYLVLLGSRLMDGYHKILGRETFIAPVTWEDGWPVVSPGTGKIEDTYPLPKRLTPHPFSGKRFDETDTDFDETDLGLEWNIIGTPREHFYQIEDSFLKLKLLKNEIVPWELDGLSADVFERLPMFKKAAGCVSFVGRRQQHVNFMAVTSLCFTPEQEESAGIVVIQNDANQLRLECRRNQEGKTEAACVSTRTVIRAGKQYFEEQEEGCVMLSQHTLQLKIAGNGIYYSFWVNETGTDVLVAEGVSGGFLGSQASGGFIGAYIGLFASGGSEKKEKYAAFDNFSYVNLKPDVIK